MRKFILLLLISAVGARAEVSRLEALSQIETGNNDRAVGGAGEVSRYQIKPWIWRQYSDSEAYSNRRISTQVAEQHLAGLREIYRKRTRREPTDFDLYVMWNAGPTYYNRIGFAKSRVHPVIRERARRYANLREALDLKVAQAKATVVAAAPAPPRLGGPITLVPAGQDTQSALSPLLPLTQAAGSPNPIFSLPPLSLASQPEAPSSGQPSGQQPIFALGGIPAK
jgi:hypothetical protein